MNHGCPQKKSLNPFCPPLTNFLNENLVVADRDSVVETMMAERERAVAERDKAVAERDRAVAERDRARTDNVAIRSERAQLAVMHQNEASTAVVGEYWATTSLSELLSSHYNSPPPHGLLDYHVTPMAVCSSLPLQATSVVLTWSQRPASRSPVRPTPSNGGAMESSFTSSRTLSQPTAHCAGWR